MSHNSPSSYMDGVKVKISEKYKPPPRINLATTYSQRLSMNKQLQDNMRVYNFSLEMSVKERMKEWRLAKNSILMQRKYKLEEITEDRKKIMEERLKCEQELKIEQAKEISTNSSCISSNRDEIIKNRQNYTSGGVLIPTQVNSTNFKQLHGTCKEFVKSPFNISDFEPETSSPFDNMELKTINDMEELKLVLQNEDKKKPNYNSYPAQQTQSNFTFGNVTSNPSYLYTNGYNYYQMSDQLHSSTDFKNYGENKAEYSSSFDGNTTQTVLQQNQQVPFRSVPDIMKELQSEIINKREISNLKFKHSDRSSKCSSPNGEVISSSVSKVDCLENPYEDLQQNLQQICDRISTMGFPLARVARACKDFGDDEKKILDHLLALSELLDLGFLEEKVRAALLQCNNDRDKALEILIL